MAKTAAEKSEKKKRFTPFRTATYIVRHPIRSAKTIVYAIATLIVIGILALTLTIGAINRSLPKIDKLSFEDFKDKATERVYQNFEVKSRHDDYRWIPLHRVNRDLLYTIVFSEDGYFFKHKGVRLRSLWFALTENIRTGSIVSGGSTLTQQVARNVFLSREKSFSRKAKEIFLAMKLEKRFSKNQLLEVYLNVAEFGPDIYGIYMASWDLFDKSPEEINALEGAMMSLLLPSPRRYHYAIFQNKVLSEDHRQKIDRVLSSMRNANYISVDQYNSYLGSSRLKKFN